MGNHPDEVGGAERFGCVELPLPLLRVTGGSVTRVKIVTIEAGSDIRRDGPFRCLSVRANGSPARRGEFFAFCPVGYTEQP